MSPHIRVAASFLLTSGIWLSAQTIIQANDEINTAPSTSKRIQAQIRGRVVMQADGKPVANADVRLVTWSENGGRYGVKKARSGKDGEFVFDAPVAGQHRLVAFFEDYASRQAMYKGEPVDLASQKPITLRLSKMPRIAARVVSKADGKPLAGARVQFIWSDTAEKNFRTDDKGNAILRGLTHEVWHVKAQAPRFAAKEEAVNLAGTESANVTFELERGAVLFGTVKDEAGQQLAGAGISVFPPHYSGPQIEYMRTNAKGEFRFENLPLKQGLQVNVSKTGFLNAQQQVLLEGDAGALKELNIVLFHRPHGGTIRGTVTDANGKPVQGATLHNEGRSSADVREATTDERGRFVLDNVYEGSIGHELVVKAKSFAPLRMAFKPGTKEKPAELTIKLEPGHRIRGRVQDDNGHPIAGVRVYHSEGNHGGSMAFGGGTTTDPNGKFEFDSLPSGAPFSFGARGYSDIEEAKLSLDGADEVVVTMQPEGMIRGRVLDAVTRKPISPFSVRITFSPDRGPDEAGHHLSGARATTPAGERFANPQGTFELNELINKMPLQVTVSAEGYEPQVYRRVLAKPKTKADEVVFALPPIDASKLVTIRGRMVDAQGKPVAGAELRLIGADLGGGRGGPEWRLASDDFPFNWQMIQSGQVGQIESVLQFQSTVSGKDGSFLFDRVRQSPAMEIAYWGEQISQGRLKEIERLSPQQRTNLTIKVVSPGVIRGNIDRKALPDVGSIMLMGAAGTVGFDYRQAEVVAKQTSYELRNIPPGKYELQVYGPYIRKEGDRLTNEVIQRHAVEVSAGETVTLDLGAQK
jgi:hypothetical protein